METSFDIPRLKAISFTSVAKALGADLKRSGRNYLTLCPWHPDKHPSLVIYEDGRQNHCHCYACDVTKDVIGYVMQVRNLTFVEACEWLSAQYSIPTLDGKKVSKPKTLPKVTMQVPTEEPVSYVPEQFVQSTVSIDNSFSNCLLQLFGYEWAHQLTMDYHLGLLKSRDNHLDTIFWTIDEEGKTHNGKVQRYVTDIRSPRFAHCETLFGKDQRSYWLTNVLKNQGVVDKKARLDVGGLFGAHLLGQRPNDPVVLVESPKNAILGAAYFPGFVWVAAGNQCALKAENVQCLRNRCVKVYPDRDAINDWKIRVLEFRSIASFQVSDFCERVAPDDKPKYDIGDYIIDKRLDDFRALGYL